MLAAMSSPRNIYIAVIDDDESVGRALSRLLRAAHLQPVVYPSAEAFLADTRRPAFECLVLDVQLPGMSGLELSHRLAAVQDPTPIVFLTAHDHPALQPPLPTPQCAAAFRKTDPGEALLATLRRLCGLDAAASDASGPRGEQRGRTNRPAPVGESRPRWTR